jgi:hypothetical protein
MFSSWKAVCQSPGKPDCGLQLVFEASRAELDTDRHPTLTPGAWLMSNDLVGHIHDRHKSDCARLAASIESFGELEPHDIYTARLKAEHGRKNSFWSSVSL